MGDQKEVKPGVKVTSEAVFIGDFKFNYEGNLIKKYKEWKDACNGDVTGNEQKVKELMAMHYAFYGQFQKENKYVKSGSVLWCSGGSKLTAFDILKDHGVMHKDGGPIGICSDCKANENIYSFEGCVMPAPAGYPERPVITVKSKPKTAMQKCIPMLNGSWSKTKSSRIKIWNESTGKYEEAISTGDFLTCFYGGIISVVEVPENNDLVKEYVTAEQLIAIGWREDVVTPAMVKELNRVLKEYDITDINSIRHFIAQASHESDDWNHKGYGDGLIEIGLKSYLEGKKYWPYIGAGYIHLTWEYNYQKFSDYLKNNKNVDDPLIMSEGPKRIASTYAWESAAYFWSVLSNANEVASHKDVNPDKLSQIVNKYDINSFQKRADIYYNKVVPNIK